MWQYQRLKRGDWSWAQLQRPTKLTIDGFELSFNAPAPAPHMTTLCRLAAVHHGCATHHHEDDIRHVVSDDGGCLCSMAGDQQSEKNACDFHGSRGANQTTNSPWSLSLSLSPPSWKSLEGCFCPEPSDNQPGSPRRCSRRRLRASPSPSPPVNVATALASLDAGQLTCERMPVSWHDPGVQSTRSTGHQMDLWHLDLWHEQLALASTDSDQRRKSSQSIVFTLQFTADLLLSDQIGRRHWALTCTRDCLAFQRHPGFVSKQTRTQSEAALHQLTE